MYVVPRSVLNLIVCPITGVLNRTDGLGFGYRPELLGSVYVRQRPDSPLHVIDTDWATAGSYPVMVFNIWKDGKRIWGPDPE